MIKERILLNICMSKMVDFSKAAYRLMSSSARSSDAFAVLK